MQASGGNILEKLINHEVFKIKNYLDNVLSRETPMKIFLSKKIANFQIFLIDDIPEAP